MGKQGEPFCKQRNGEASRMRQNICHHAACAFPSCVVSEKNAGSEYSIFLKKTSSRFFKPCRALRPTMAARSSLPARRLSSKGSRWPALAINVGGLAVAFDGHKTSCSASLIATGTNGRRHGLMSARTDGAQNIDVFYQTQTQAPLQGLFFGYDAIETQNIGPRVKAVLAATA